MSSCWKALAATFSPDHTRRGPVPLPQAGTVADVSDVSDWRAIVSGEAELHLRTSEGPGVPALRLDFDFHGSGGFVVARRELRLGFPESYSVRFSFRGSGAVNDLEVKWVDPAGSSVWRHVMRLSAWPDGWRAVELRDRDFPFAWGPAGGGRIGEAGALELVVVAREGGCGTVCFSEMQLVDRTVYEAPSFSASSHGAGHPAAAAGDPLNDQFWESRPDDPEPVWTVDWKGEREFGGLAIRWARSPFPAFAVECSVDGQNWKEWSRAEGTTASATFLNLPGAEARFLRLRFDGTRGSRPAVLSVEIMPPEFGESREAVFHTLASMAPRGWFPRYWLREQSYWTPAGPPGGAPRGLMNEEGLVEPGFATFSLEPFLWNEDRLITWAEVDCRHELTEGWMPLPVTWWETETWKLTIEAGATDEGFVVRYRLENLSGTRKAARLFLAIRPFQVTPPWQAFRGLGGVGRLEGLCRTGVNTVAADDWTLCCGPAPASFGVHGSTGGELLEVLAAGGVPTEECITDRSGLASGAWAWDLEMPAGEVREVEVVATVGSPPEGDPPAVTLKAAAQAWHGTAISQAAWKVRCGHAEARGLTRDLRAAAAHILVNRDGPALQPGPRRYQRCWIRDAAGMARALLYGGCHQEVRDLLTWYAPYIREDGTVPCCVDREGPDWLPEHDSQGQYVHVLAEYARFGGDRVVVERLWPVACRTLERLAALRQTRMTAAYRNGIPPHRFGLLPESASHEGYLAHPVHAYWDDFWALRGLRDAVWLAQELGDHTWLQSLQSLRDSFTETLGQSLAGLVAERGLDFVPGSVEWADFDPSATANGIALLDELPGVGGRLLEQTFSRYLEGFRKRRDGEVPWENYTPYEIRIAGAYVRLGRRQEAWELLRRFLDDRRPREWGQWPEIAWRDSRAPGHLGDVPHSWIGAEFVAAARSLFAYERDTDDSLVLAAGLPMDWLRGEEGIAIEGWATACGPLTYSVQMRNEAEWHLSIGSGLRVPDGGVVLALPDPGRPVEFLVGGATQAIPEDHVLRLRVSPAEVKIRFARP